MRWLAKWLGLGLGSGLSPKAPGTAGSLVAVIIAALIPVVHEPLFLIISALLGVWVCELAERDLGKKDDGRIVFDEFVGQWIAVAGFSGYYLLGGFILFRLFDITKPTPIRQLQKFHGGIGIMIDDILAGMMAWVALFLVKTFIA